MQSSEDDEYVYLSLVHPVMTAHPTQEGFHRRRRRGAFYSDPIDAPRAPLFLSAGIVWDDEML